MFSFGFVGFFSFVFLVCFLVLLVLFFLVLFGGGGFVMTPPCSPVFWWIVWPSLIPLFKRMSFSLRYVPVPAWKEVGCLSCVLGRSICRSCCVVVVLVISQVVSWPVGLRM